MGLRLFADQCVPNIVFNVHAKESKILPAHTNETSLIFVIESKKCEHLR